MPLHPQAQAMIAAYSPDPSLDYDLIQAPELRALFAIPAPSAPPRSDLRVEDRRILGAGGEIGLRLYRPLAVAKVPLEGRGDADESASFHIEASSDRSNDQGEPGDDARAWPITIYLHGGGFVLGDLDTTDALCRTLAERARTLVVSVDYRLAPEAPFPAGLDDAYAALRWVHDHAEQIGGDRERIAVAGDSSGGNFAAALAQRARHEGPRLRHQLLLYPVLDAGCDHPSYREFAEGYFLSAPMMRWYWRQYLGGAHSVGSADLADPADPRVSPLHAEDLRGLPAATIFSAEYDVLRDEAEAYAQALAEAGVAVELKRWDGQIHGFLLQQGAVDAADAALDDAAAALRAAFA